MTVESGIPPGPVRKTASQPMFLSCGDCASAFRSAARAPASSSRAVKIPSPVRATVNDGVLALSLAHQHAGIIIESTIQFIPDFLDPRGKSRRPLHAKITPARLVRVQMSRQPSFVRRCLPTHLLAGPFIRFSLGGLEGQLARSLPLNHSDVTH